MEHCLLQEGSAAHLAHTTKTRLVIVRGAVRAPAQRAAGSHGGEWRVWRRNDAVKNNKTPPEKGEHHRHSPRPRSHPCHPCLLCHASRASRAAASRKPPGAAAAAGRRQNPTKKWEKGHWLGRRGHRHAPTARCLHLRRMNTPGVGGGRRAGQGGAGAAKTGQPGSCTHTRPPHTHSGPPRLPQGQAAFHHAAATPTTLRHPHHTSTTSVTSATPRQSRHAASPRRRVHHLHHIISIYHTSHLTFTT
ncbi:hypothetical protein E2C01_035460 [Portunus trituberculatus]|uniref:Uncharacterized protein n=1 Tax=Portunus trituberculatus TaxID=210409 RepID=A0A5B7F5X1_PORTR|nr:hypothetical protein [Portunus trituberculatus]